MLTVSTNMSTIFVYSFAQTVKLRYNKIDFFYLSTLYVLVPLVGIILYIDSLLQNQNLRVRQVQHRHYQ